MRRMLLVAVILTFALPAWAAFDVPNSPENRAATGPLPRFARMVEGPTYRALLDHRRYAIGPVEARRDQTFVPVIVEARDRRDYGFVWVLRRPTQGALRGCWVTDAVIPAALSPGDAPERGY